jgi:hypothetical protein
MLFSLLLLMGCQSVETARELPRKRVTDVNLNGYKDPTMKKRLMVMPFLDADDRRDPQLREAARKAFIADLNRSGQLIALDSVELRIDADKYIQNGDYNLKDVSKQASQLGVNSILEGKVMDLKVKRSSDQIGLVRNMTTKFESVVRVRVVNARGGKELMNIVKTVTLEEPTKRVGERVETDKYIQNNPELVQIIIKDAFMDFTPQVIAALDKVTWEGRIAAISGDRMYLNVGRISGLQVGDILKVSEEGEDVYDPDSGTHLGKVAGRMKGTLEVVSYFGTDGAVAVIHSGSGFKENDKVELY